MPSRISLTWQRVALVNFLAVAWFLTITVACRFALPDIALFRCPIGLCLGGYQPEQLTAVLDAIGPDGRGFLMHTLLPLDTVMPVLVTLALVLSLAWATRPDGENALDLDRRVRTSLFAVPFLYGFADYAENWMIARALDAYPNIPYSLATLTSRLTAAKSQMLVAAVGLVIAFAVARWWWSNPRRVEPNC